MLRHWAAAMVLVGLLVPAARAEPQTVTVQLVRSIAQAPYYIAVDKGYFAKEGITVQSGNVRRALDTIAPLATNSTSASAPPPPVSSTPRTRVSICASSRRLAFRGR